MRKITKPLSLFSLAVLVGCTQQVDITQEEIDQLKIEARKARDVNAIQNLMSRRAMYHSIGHNEKELELWSKKQEIRWAQNQGCWIGRDAYEEYYVTVNYAMQKASLEQISKLNPNVENDYSKNRYIGSNVFHLLTTPIIEIAEDGKSAKAFWYTPGAILSTEDGLTASAVNMWEKYYVDLVREDDEWRFLHVEVLTDWANPFGEPLQVVQEEATMGSEGAVEEDVAPGPGAEGIAIPGPTVSKTMYESYSPTRVPTLGPGLPEPYTTLSETFEYADCN